LEENMAKKLLIALALVLGLLLVGGFLLPTAYQVTRSVGVKAPLARVQPLLEDLKRWPEWSPWEQADTTIVISYGSVTAGVGASQSWTDRNGGGRLELLVCQPGRVEYDVYFSGSETAHRTVMSASAGDDGYLLVSWTMSGEMDVPVVGPYLKLLADRLMGPMFERGLASLKVAAERP
jgi:hypothetical protein